jgi:hypothetical protein
MHRDDGHTALVHHKVVVNILAYMQQLQCCALLSLLRMLIALSARCIDEHLPLSCRCSLHLLAAAAASAGTTASQ